MRHALGIALAASAMVTVSGQVEPRLTGQLRVLFPAAMSFSGRTGMPPHFEAYAGAAASREGLMGIAVWTTDLDPLERGYDGPVKILVGIDMRGTLTGVVVADHHEPYGYFSVDLPEFAAQFKGKSVRDPFVVGKDIDAVSRATLTVTSATRAIRNASRRAATALIPPPR
jgi:NosR/NirI family transcriptional regulator, nitrous oxide reductase regulator